MARSELQVGVDMTYNGAVKVGEFWRLRWDAMSAVEVVSATGRVEALDVVGVRLSYQVEGGRIDECFVPWRRVVDMRLATDPGVRERYMAAFDLRDGI